MPLTEPDVANPPALASHIPQEVLSLVTKIPTPRLDNVTSRALSDFKRAADYIAAAMIFLGRNVLVEQDLTFDDIKPRLLGHWGTCPGLTLVYAHLNLLIRENDLDMIFCVGPGHGAPAILASLWLEGSLGRFYPEYSRNRNGLHNLISKFSTPTGLPRSVTSPEFTVRIAKQPDSHINAETPGSIHEGGELGYVLSVAFGAIMDKPDLIACAVIGDGEAETGPTATAWHAYKYIDPKESGAVLPIVHVNGFKISERTIYGCMDNKELACLFTGYGYQPRFVESLENIDADMVASMRWALGEIHKIQTAARSGHPIFKPRWPVLILRTPKGWGGPKSVHGEFVEGSFRSHQVPLPNSKSDIGELKALQSWLRSYNASELIDVSSGVARTVDSIIPRDDKRKLGQNPQSYDAHEALHVPDWTRFSVSKKTLHSCLATSGDFLDQVLVQNPHSVRIFSPDELVSNKLDAVFRHTERNFQWDQYATGKGGRVIEILSEHTCQGFLQGYTMTGRTGLFPSYESFLGIIHTMMVQYSKFSKLSREVSWRRDLSSINYIETSTWTRQEHNGFSHQNPSFIGAVLDIKPTAARVYLPPDPNTFLSTLAHCLRSKNYVNLIVGSKQPQPVWLDASEAEAHCKTGGSIWEFASTDTGANPDVVLVGIGADLMFEVLAAAAYLRHLAPSLRVRVVNVTDLMILGLEYSHPHSLSHDAFDNLFTAEQHIHFNYSGYANELQGLLFGRPKLDRISIDCYREEGSTTTPFDMVIRNRASRYHVAERAVKGGAKNNEEVKLDMHSLLGQIRHDMAKAQEHIKTFGKDPQGTYDPPIFGEKLMNGGNDCGGHHYDPEEWLAEGKNGN